MIKSNVLALDLAKNVIQVCKINTHGELVYNKAVSPQKLKQILAQEKSSVVAMEGCGGCHYWSRFAQNLGHEARIISPKRVKANLSGQKTDANDAVAIAVTSQQFGIKFSQIKSEEQQCMQTLECSRKLLSKQHLSLSNHIRSFMYEYGITSPKGKIKLRECIANVLDPADKRLPQCLKSTLALLWRSYLEAEKELTQITKNKNALTSQLDPCKRLLQLEGVGPVCAALLYASLGEGQGFKNGREASVYVGVTPMQHSSGGKVIMTGINRHGGDKELRAALFQGAFSVIHKLPPEPKTIKQAWLMKLVARVGIKRACIALANKTVRTAWALLANKSTYKPLLLQS